MKKFFYKTTFLASWAGGKEREYELGIAYGLTEASPQTMVDPGSDADVEILRVTMQTPKGVSVPVPAWLDEEMGNDEDLKQVLLCDAAERMECERDEAADRRREMILERARAL